MKKFFSFMVIMLVLILPISISASEKGESWVILLYLCGSDLESQGGAATTDISEILEAKLPSNVKVIVQTGGAKKWQDYGIKKNKIGRYLIQNGEMTLLENLPNANMGDPSTLEDFLSYVEANYQSDRKMLIFWNHGGGSASGVAFDENYEDEDGNADYLSLLEIDDALINVGKKYENLNYDIVGFDACLMATVDSAFTFLGYADYMIASQEVEPGIGWSYTGWLNALGKNTSIDSADLGKIIVDTYFDGVEEIGLGGEQTLSVIDINKIGPLVYYYNQLGIDASKSYISNGNSFLQKYKKAAKSADNFSNDMSSGQVTGMVDLGEFITGLKKVLPGNSELVLNALNDAVVYNRSGPYHSANGLSIYYPLDKKAFEELTGMLSNNVQDDGFKIFNYYQSDIINKSEMQKRYKYLVAFLNENKELLLSDNSEDTESSEDEEIASDDSTETEETTEAVAQNNSSSSVHNSIADAIVSQTQDMFANLVIKDVDLSSLQNLPVDLDNNSDFKIKLTPAQMDLIDDISFNLYFLSKEDNVFIEFGSDANLVGDWETGEFSAQFNGDWPCFDGHVLKMDIVHTSEQYFRYNVPIKVNGVRANMTVVYDFNDEEYHIHSIRKQSQGSASERASIRLKPGDKITTIVLASPLDSDEESKEFEIDTFTYKADSQIKDESLGDGTFRLEFVFSGINGDKVTSAVVESEIKGDEITNTIFEDEE
jgi:hypothetical protein